MKSTEIIEKLKKLGVEYKCNDNISEHITEKDINDLVDEVSDKFGDVLKSLVIDIDNCPNTKDTARRVSKMLINELFSGRYLAKPIITGFPMKYDSIYTAGPITIRSTCAHHWQTIDGLCWIGIFPSNEEVLGLSKYNRIVNWLSSRPTIQEELAIQIANEIENDTHAKGVAVVLRAKHHCVTSRGVKEHNSDMITSVMRGIFKDDNDVKSEFIQLITNSKSYKDF